MDSEKAVLTSALQTGSIAGLLARGIEARHFSRTKSGEECESVFTWAAFHARKYGVSPSLSLVKSNFPEWRGEPSSDPLEALIDEFLRHVKRRHFEAKVLELAQYAKRPGDFHRLDEIMLDAARDLSTIVPSGQVSRFRADMQERIDQYEIEKDEGITPGFNMGIPLFDDLTGGFRPGNVVTVAGYSGRGKSTMALWFLANCLEQEAPSLLLTLEMTRREVMERLDTMNTHFSQKQLERRDLPDNDVEIWKETAKKYQGAQNDLVVVDKLGGCPIDRVYAEINRYKPKITCVDYVQLMKSSRASMQKYEALVEITNELKAIALSTDSTIVMVSQDQRGSADDGSTEKNMGGSVSVIQAADIYIGMMQDDFMRENKKMEVRLLKNRKGPPAETSLLWEPEYMRFKPWQDDVTNFTKVMA